MATFELSHQVATAKQQAKQLTKNLKALQQTLKDTNTDTTILQDLNLCIAKAQELSCESFLFIEKEAENARKITNYITSLTISETISKLAKQARIPSSQSPLAVLVLRYYFDGANGDINRKTLEKKLREAEMIGNLGDFPWTSDFEDVMEGYREKVEKLAVEIVVEEVKGTVEGQIRGCFAVKDE